MSPQRPAQTPNLSTKPAPTEPRRKYEQDKLAKKLRRHVGNAIVDYTMIDPDDHVMVCLSGGKDSYVMLDVLLNLQKHAPVPFTITAVNLDQKQPGFPEHVLPAYLEELGVPHLILEEDTYSIVQDKTPEGKTTCPICSRLRRGILYSCAKRIGADKIALGHHLDDAVETLFLNLFHGGRMKSMPPKLQSDDGGNVVIRPLYYCREADIAMLAAIRGYPIIPCNLCGSQENLQRQVIKSMLAEWDTTHPGRVEQIARGMRHVSASHLGDAALFDFASLAADRGLLPVVERL